MHDIVCLGSAPTEESCAQIGDPDYTRNAKAECRSYMEAIRKVCGREPKGARLTIKSQQHDFGSYYEVAVMFDGDNREAADYDYRCEGKAPATWEEARMQPLVVAERGRA